MSLISYICNVFYFFDFQGKKLFFLAFSLEKRFLKQPGVVA